MSRILHFTQTPDGLAKIRQFASALISSPGIHEAEWRIRFDQASGEFVRHDTVPATEGATAFLARELQYVTARTFDVLFKPTKARELIPFTSNVPAGAETYAYDQWEHFGVADFVSDRQTQFPKADVRKKRFSFPMRSIGTSYDYTDQDVQAARMAGGQGLDFHRGQAARMVVEQKLDDLLAFGDSLHGIRGIAGQTDFTAVSPVTGSWSSSTTQAQLFGDLNKLVLAGQLATGGLFMPDTLVLPLAVKPLLVNPWSTTANPTTIEQAWLATQDQSKSGIKAIEYWNKLDLANAGGTGGRALCYTKTDQVLEALLSYDYQEFIEPSSGLVIEIKAKARVGGLAVHYPLACSYMDIQ